MQSSGMKAGLKLLFATVMLLVVFGAVEILLRVVGVDQPTSPRLVVRAIDVDISFPFMRPDRDLFWSPIPGFRGQFLDETVTINSMGLRGADVAVPKPATKKRILCFGDSITFGYGVSDDETYAFHLGQALTPQGVEVINCGVTGYSSYQTLHLLRRVATRLEGDLALFLIGWNDSAERPVDDLAYARRVQISMAMETLSNHWYLYRLVKSFYLRSFEHEWEETHTLQPRATTSQYLENMETIVTTCRSSNIVPVFINLPRRKREGEAPFQSEYDDVLEVVAAGLDVPLIDAGDLGLETTLPSNDRYFIDTLHFSPEGHAYLAGTLARELADLGVP
jgi:lysophospholipase L1-like esterase